GAARCASGKGRTDAGHWNTLRAASGAKAAQRDHRAGTGENNGTRKTPPFMADLRERLVTPEGWRHDHKALLMQARF
ncbi:MAG TPA: hypothetical protein VIH96_21560, partial [Paraburkholderia sp.]